MKIIYLLAFFLLVQGQRVSAQEAWALPETDRIRLAEAFRIAETLGDEAWNGWSKAPFAVLLVTNDYEYLIRHPAPSKDFAQLGHDPLLKSDVYVRKRTQPTNFLATFPFIGGVSTIVIGQAENTRLTSTPWVVTVLHEHFHQLQESQPRHFADVNALNLARGDQTGMWMLNYPFPYANSDVARQFNALSGMLAGLLQIRERSEFQDRLAAYLDARRKFEISLDADDYRYLSFQLWKEGVARYTELRITQMAAKSGQPSKEFQALKDYSPYGEVADRVMKNILKELSEMKFDQSRREAVYSFGAAEALLLDRENPNWRSRYFTEKFDLGVHLLKSR